MTLPLVVFDDTNGDKFAFKDPVDAMEYVVSLGAACCVIDAEGTLVHYKDLVKMYDQYNRYDYGRLKPKMNKFEVNIHTDGACKGNPGPGGYAAIIVMGDKEKTIRGYELAATNNAMELKAVVEAVKQLTSPCEVTVHTDSQYLCTCSKHNKAWFERADRPNKDLWWELITVGLAGKHHIKFVKVAGHTGEVYNERCDRIAKEQATKACHVLASMLG